MSDTSDNDRKPEVQRGGTLTLKRPTVEQSKVKQSFAHGRSKTVVVETKRKRFGDEKPATAEAKPQTAFQVQPKVAPSGSDRNKPAAPVTPRSGVVLRTLTAEEKDARDRALAGARERFAH